MLEFPDEFQIDYVNKTITFLVPKFHLPAHVSKCQTAYSFNLTRGVGRTDGEAPERGWADINRVAASTKEMGPASRRDTLDDHFGDWNHQKIIGLGEYLFLHVILARSYGNLCSELSLGASLLRKLKVAVPERNNHVVDYELFSESLPASSVLEWTDAVEAWEKDNSETNPYVATVKSESDTDICRTCTNGSFSDNAAWRSFSLG
jgi:hypothetical protein